MWKFLKKESLKIEKNNVMTECIQSTSNHSKMLLAERYFHFFLCGGLCLLIAIICVAYKSSSFPFIGYAWYGIHDPLIFKNSLAQWWVVMLSSGVILALLRHVSFIIYKDRLSCIIILLVGIGLSSVLWSEFPGYSLNKALMWVSAYLIYLFTIQCAVSKRSIHVLLYCVFYSAVCIACIGLIQSIFGYDAIPQSISPASTFGNKNMACHPLVISFPMGLYFLLRDPHNNKINVFPVAIGLAIILAFIFHSQTRAAWASIAISLCVVISVISASILFKKEYVSFSSKQIQAVILGLALLGMILNLNYDRSLNTLSLGGSVDKIERVVQKSVRDVSDAGTLSGRSIIWSRTAENIKRHPWLGAGLGHFFSEFQQSTVSKKPQARRAHNDYLEMVLEIGVIGFAVFLLSVGLFLYYIYRILTSDDLTQDHYLITTVILAGSVGSGVNAMLSFPFFHILPMILMSIYVAIIVTFYHQCISTQTVDSHYKVQDKTKWIVLALMSLYCLVSFRVAYNIERTEYTINHQLSSQQWHHVDVTKSNWWTSPHFFPTLYSVYTQLKKQYIKLNTSDQIATLSEDQLAKFKVKMQIKLRYLTAFTYNLLDLNSPDIFFIKHAQFLIRQNQLNDAYHFLNEVKKQRSSQSFQITIMLIDIHRRSGHYDKASHELESLIHTTGMESINTSWRKLYHIGSMLYKLGDIDKGLSYLKIGLDKFPDKKGFSRFIALCHFAKNDEIAAIPYMRAYLKLEKNTKTAKIFRDKLKDLVADDTDT
jgi:O-antigen ligase